MRVRGAPAVPGGAGRQVRRVFAYLRARCSAGARRGLMGRRRRRRSAPTGREEGNRGVEREDTAEHDHDDRRLALHGCLVHPRPRGLSVWGAQRSRRLVAFGLRPRRGRGHRRGDGIGRGRSGFHLGNRVRQGKGGGGRNIFHLRPVIAALYLRSLIARRGHGIWEQFRDGGQWRELRKNVTGKKVCGWRAFAVRLTGERRVHSDGRSVVQEITEIRQRCQLRQRGELRQRSKVRKVTKLGEIRGTGQRLPVPSIGGARWRLVVGTAVEVIVAHETFLPCNRARSALAAVNGDVGRPHARQPRRCQAAENGGPTRRAP